jgi:YggT family protein
MCDALNAFLLILELAIIGRVLYSWVDPSPYPTNRVKDILWRITEPMLGPVRRVLPQTGMLDLSPMVVLIGIIVLREMLLTGLCY